MRVFKWGVVAAMFVAVQLSGQASHAALSEFYVGVDGLETIASGTYGGLANPNHGRLTLLYNHGNHYHGIGTYSYSGPNSGPTTVDTNSNNRLPETYTAQPPLVLTAGSGVYAGKLVSNPQFGIDYSNLEMRTVHSLSGNPEDTEGLYVSSSGRWDDFFDDAHIHLELVSITPGLNVGTPTNPTALTLGGDVHVGEGNEMFSFTPVLWTDDAAAPGIYSAEFRLVDESGTFGDSGRFYIDAQVVPEPASMTLLGAGGLLALGIARKRRLRT